MLTLIAALSLSACHVSGYQQAVECGTLQVPVSRADGAATDTQLAVHLIRASAEQEAAIPVVMLPGGPGQAGSDITAVGRAILGETGRVRDVIFPDYRGTGKSGALTCKMDDPEAMLDPARVRAGLTQCRDRLEREAAAPLDAYTTNAIVDDLDAMRAALGYEQVHLYGGSYGTRVALVYLRRHPERVASVVLDAVAPLGWAVGGSMGADAQAALDAVLTACAAQLACAEAFPSVGARFLARMRRLSQEPEQVPLTDPVTGQLDPTEVDARVLAGMLRGVLYSAELSRLVPWMLDRAADGDYQPLFTAGYTFSGDLDEQISFGLMLSILCAEDIGRVANQPAPETEAASFVGDMLYEFWNTACEVWPVKPVDAAFDTATASDTPALLLSGAWDPVTPAANAARAAEALSNSRQITLPGTGHLAGYKGCMPKIIAEFYDTLDPAALDVECLEPISEPPFMLNALAPLPHSEAARDKDPQPESTP